MQNSISHSDGILQIKDKKVFQLFRALSLRQNVCTQVRCACSLLSPSCPYHQLCVSLQSQCKGWQSLSTLGNYQLRTLHGELMWRAGVAQWI